MVNVGPISILVGGFNPFERYICQIELPKLAALGGFSAWAAQIFLSTVRGGNSKHI